jgi:hypothetical protein
MLGFLAHHADEKLQTAGKAGLQRHSNCPCSVAIS